VHKKIISHQIIGGQKQIQLQQQIVESAVAGALAVQKQSFEIQLQEMNERIGKLTVNTPEVETYVDAEIRPGVVCCCCNEPLDIVKFLPDFEGKIETYVSWRKAAHVAF